ncbi:hypothetical protein [Thermodesulfatator atlanticus]|uniref:hypothetical protein n=1 Tax=Thermodesulfatator atlanticus TaxID=501497 RepID=UPI0012F75D4B|nr:hypothetical protein [Thermodesulfatator atlanticus]
MKKNTEKKPPAPPQVNFFEKIKGQKVVIQSRAGTRYEGTFEAYKDGFFWLKNAIIVGNEFKAETELVAIDRGQTAHLHLYPTKVEKASQEG